MPDSIEPPAGGTHLLLTGARLGAYTVVDRLGKGGMGEVYRARDTRLQRDVALKVVRGNFIHDPERLKRFEREARILASLNHPHIASIYGFEDSAGTPALVMELVEGPTLSDRIGSRGLPIEESLSIAQQIAEGLEYAHERGIVHRDLKPANIKLSGGDSVKVLDFGLAKALEPDLSSPNLSEIPTMSLAATGAGVVLGTPAYMSPEQAMGQPVDRRSDIWAFGCVLFELLTGKRAFHGDSSTDTIAAMLREEPMWSALPVETPAPVRLLLRHCLRKDPRKRLQAIGDARIVLEDLLGGSGDTQHAAGEQRRQSAGFRPAVLLVSLAGAALIASFATWYLKPSPVPVRRVTRFTISLPAGRRLMAGFQELLALSADGKRLAYVAQEGGNPPQIYLRDLDRLDATPIAGTEGAIDPFFSPDGDWLGFFADGKLRKIPASGGNAKILAVATAPRGGVWSPLHEIDFSVYPSAIGGVSDNGGSRREVTQLAGGDSHHDWPDVLDGGRAILFSAIGGGSSSIEALDTRNGARHPLVEGENARVSRYLPPGYLIYERDGDLWAAPFDADRLAVTGEAARVVKGVVCYAVSASGALAYVVGKQQLTGGRLVWVGRDGKVRKILGVPSRYYYQPRVEPRSGRILADVIDRSLQVWLYDPTGETMAPVTFGDPHWHGIWVPGGKRITYTSERGIFSQVADGSAGPEQLTQIPAGADAGTIDIPYSWTPDGRQLSFVRYSPIRPGEFMVAKLDGRREGPQGLPPVEPIFEMTTADGAPQFSPDGHWLAYASEDERGHRQIFVRAYPGPGGLHQVSIGGGNEPQWNPNGRELFFLNGDKMMAVDITTEPAFAQGKPHELFEGPYSHVQPSFVRANYDVSSDGQRFLMVEPEQLGPPLTEIQVVLNLPEELQRLVGPHG